MPVAKSTLQQQACHCVASLSWWPEVSWAKWSRNNSPLYCQSRSTWDIWILATRSPVLLVIFSGQIQVCEHPHGTISQPGSPPRRMACPHPQQCLVTCASPDGFVSALPVSLIPLLQPPSPLPPSMDQYKVLATSLAQQCSKPAGELYCEIALWVYKNLPSITVLKQSKILNMFSELWYILCILSPSD